MVRRSQFWLVDRMAWLDELSGVKCQAVKDRKMIGGDEDQLIWRSMRRMAVMSRRESAVGCEGLRLLAPLDLNGRHVAYRVLCQVRAPRASLPSPSLPNPYQVLPYLPHPALGVLDTEYTTLTLIRRITPVSWEQ